MLRFVPGCFLLLVIAPGAVFAAGGSLTVTAREEEGEETITRLEVYRADAPSRLVPIRKAVPVGLGVVLDRSLELSLPHAAYRFRMIRGPEYRIISGTFALERTSLDSHKVDLPRMIHMLDKGWTSGDCCVLPTSSSIPMRMASEDLHLAATLGEIKAKPVPGRDPKDPIEHQPIWIQSDVVHRGGLVFYRSAESADDPLTEPTASGTTASGTTAESVVSDLPVDPLPVELLVATDHSEFDRVAVENPFAWALPVWLASDRVDGIFILGDWLRLDRNVSSLRDGRGPQGPSVGGGKALGRWAERIYWNMLEAGFRIPPLAGSGDQAGATPIGYNRLYVAQSASPGNSDQVLDVRPVTNSEQWWQSAWAGRSVATNGPLLCPKLAGQIPGHVFYGEDQEVLILQPELRLAVRDPVDYLEVIHNNEVHYSARLDEFARAGGVIPPIHVEESGWVTIRVVTLYEDHFRAAMTAPWYIEFPSGPRVTEASVAFFQDWLADYEERLKMLPPAELQRHVPFVRAARDFWQHRAEAAKR